MDEEIRGMVHRGDPDTSRKAAHAISNKLRKLQVAVLVEIAKRPRTDEELEKLPQFSNFGPSTIRKRRSELYQAGLVQDVGRRTNSRNRQMIIWSVVPHGSPK